MLPNTRAGRLAVWLTVAFVAWFVAWALLEPRDMVPLPLFIAGSLLGLAIGVASGAVALVAILWRGERGALVYVTLLPALFAAGLLVFELLVPH